MQSAMVIKQTPHGTSRIIPGKKYGVFRVKDSTGSIGEILSNFKPLVDKLDYWTLDNTMGALRAQPDFQAFRSNFREVKFRLELAGCVAKGELAQAAVLMVTESGSDLAAAIWIKGQGTFFYNFLDRQESVESVLEQVPKPTVPEGPARVAARVQDQPGYKILASKRPGYGEFRIPDNQIELRKVANELGVVPDMMWNSRMRSACFYTLKTRFDALKMLSEARDFMAKFEHTQLHFELAGKIKNGTLAEAAVYIMTAGSSQPVAVISWERGQGDGFFKHLLN